MKVLLSNMLNLNIMSVFKWELRIESLNYKIAIFSFFLLFNLSSISSVSAATVPLHQETNKVPSKEVVKSKKRTKPNFIQRILIKKLTKRLEKQLNSNKKEKEIRTNATLSWVIGLASVNSLIFAIAFSSVFLLISWGLLAVIALVFGILARVNSRDEKEKFVKERKMANIGLWIAALSLILPLVFVIVLFIVLLATLGN